MQPTALATPGYEIVKLVPKPTLIRASWGHFMVLRIERPKPQPKLVVLIGGRHSGGIQKGKFRNPLKRYL